MSSPWESIVSVAREIDGAFATGREPELAVVMRLARAVLDFQQGLASARVTIKPPPVSERNSSDAAAE